MSARLLKMAREVEQRLARRREERGPEDLDAQIAEAQRVAERGVALVQQGEKFMIDTRAGVIRFHDGRVERLR